jgi:transglutaminase-like putative cysteine protease
MSVLTVRHITTYRYRTPVQLGEHRMMFRPRESHDLKLLKTSLSISPHPSRLRWLHDVFDNSIAIAEFEGSTMELHFESVITLEHFETTLPKYPVEEYATYFPFHYSREDTPNLSRALAHNYPHANVSYWVKQFLDTSGTTGTMDLLRSMTNGIKEQFQYVRRSKKGIQTPDETIASGQGSCRDFAVLMMEATRSLGIAARFVSGYILVPGKTPASDFSRSADVKGGGATHAWMQAFLPGAGWIDFDPTNAIVGNRNLIRVAMAWSPENILPLWGTFVGHRDDFIEMNVSVNVAEVDESLLDGLLPARY